MFAKGDMVRVKAGSPRYCSQGSTMGPYETDYGKGFVVKGVRGYNNVVCCMLSGTNAINAEYLEPWNDKEEWNGYQWVAKSTGVDESKEIHERNMRYEWKPRVGDAVRVKAGTPPYADREDCSGIGCPSESQFGRKLIYDNSNILTEYLEPWNDREEWDGKKWVAKWHPVPPDGPKVDLNNGVECDMSLVGKVSTEPTDPFVPDEVIISGVRFVRKQEEKSNAENAEHVFKTYIPNGFEEYFSEDSIMATVKVVSVCRTGNRITVVYDAGE